MILFTKGIASIPFFILGQGQSWTKNDAKMTLKFSDQTINAISIMNLVSPPLFDKYFVA
jgi:hypothetical protein